MGIEWFRAPDPRRRVVPIDDAVPEGWTIVAIGTESMLIEGPEGIEGLQRRSRMSMGNIVYLIIVGTLLAGTIFAVWKLTPGH